MARTSSRRACNLYARINAQEASQMNPVDEVGSKLGEWREHPAQFVEEQFGVKPDAWQAEALEAFPHSPLLAMRACAGPGKTAVLAWIGWNFLLTREEPYIGATSITGDNLRANLWTELGRWYARGKLLTEWFTTTKTTIFSNNFPHTWKLEARSGS